MIETRRRGLWTPVQWPDTLLSPEPESPAAIRICVPLELTARSAAALALTVRQITQNASPAFRCPLAPAHRCTARPIGSRVRSATIRGVPTSYVAAGAGV